MKIARKSIALIIGATLLVGVGVVVVFSAFRQIEDAALLRTRANAEIFQADRLLSELRDAETGQRGYVLTQDENFLEPYLAVLPNVRAHLDELRQLTQNDTARNHLDAVVPLLDLKMGELAKVIALCRNQDMSAALAIVRDGYGKQLMDSIRAEMRAYAEVETVAQVQHEAQFQSNMRRLFGIITAASVFVLLLAASFAFLIHREAQHRLENQLLGETQHLLEIQNSMNQRLREANMNLVVSEEKLAVTLGSIGDAVIATDGSGLVTFLNPVAEQLTGWTRADASGRPVVELFKIINPDTREPFVCPVTKTLEHGTLQGLANHTVLVARDGSERPIADSCAPIRDHERRVVGAVLVFRDVTAEYAAQLKLLRALTELNQANAALSQTSRLKDEFLANMSHELRTPLNAILGLSEALLEQVTGPLSPRQVKSITTISSSGQHLLALINDILDLSKIDAGKLELNLEALSMDEFCQSCLVFVRTQAMHKRIDVSFEHDGRSQLFTADPKRFKQVLVNLLTNAVKFTPEGGHIGLSVETPKGKDVVLFTVWDHGIGIAPTDAAKLFSAFTQIDSGLSRAQEGTGLGLALVAKLVELHGGSVALESAPGKGSRFVVTLPRGSPSAAPFQMKREIIAGTERWKYRRALVIEDDPTAGAILIDYLTELGMECTLHTRGDKSTEAVLRERPDVIMLDIQLPGESGWVVLAKLKEHLGARDIPVVVVSVVDEPRKSYALGAVAHFTKPISRAQLAEFFQRDAAKVLRPAGALGLGPVILLAEDNEANVQTVGGYLSDKGFAMSYAKNGIEAVQLARELFPELILMDIQMPVMDGLTAIREIRADARLATVPIIALTALAMPGDRERCIAAGATDYMSKPVSLKALTELVERLVGKVPRTEALQPSACTTSS